MHLIFQCFLFTLAKSFFSMPVPKERKKKVRMGEKEKGGNARGKGRRRVGRKGGKREEGRKEDRQAGGVGRSWGL